ncbi:MAG TPA: radical SAM protein [Terriglobales bacterium]|nr:radical SAM protein [Terriglobales bacterium]
MSSLFREKVTRVLTRKADAFLGRIYPLQKTLDAMASRPFELHLELTNLCNANCVFCPYQFQQRQTQFMSDEVFGKAIGDYVATGGGSVGLTPIVGDALIDPKFLDRVRYLRSLPQIDRIWLTTNCILLDKFGIDAVLQSGITALNVSTAGFDQEMYRRVYRNASYQRMRSNVLELVSRNADLGSPVAITIALRPDRPLKSVLADPDFQPILAHHPQLDFTWSFTSAGGRITREILPASMKLRTVASRRESCVNTYNGPIVLPDGTVLGCNCVAAMDATKDLSIGNILQTSLADIWAGEEIRRLRSSFGTAGLNSTCANCDMYRDLEFYRTRDGRRRGALNIARAGGSIIRTETTAARPFSGG